jgi:hypothetical protein
MLAASTWMVDVGSIGFEYVVPDNPWIRRMSMPR